jgi:hypothetical protein
MNMIEEAFCPDKASSGGPAVAARRRVGVNGFGPLKSYVI